MPPFGGLYGAPSKRFGESEMNVNQQSYAAKNQVLLIDIQEIVFLIHHHQGTQKKEAEFW